MIHKTTIKITFLALLLIVTGCGVYRGTFDCRPGKGVGCESVSQVNDLVNNDKLDDFIEEVNSPRRRGRKCPSCEDREYSDSTHTMENKEKLKIYFNQYKDRNGIVHKPSEVEIEVK